MELLLIFAGVIVLLLADKAKRATPYLALAACVIVAVALFFLFLAFDLGMWGV